MPQGHASFRALVLILIVAACWAATAVPVWSDPPPEATSETGKWIDQFVAFSQPGVGYLSTADASGFVAVDGPTRFEGGILGTPSPSIPTPMRDVVRQGVAALPALLAHLTDKRPTQITVRPFAGAMWFTTDYDPRQGPTPPPTNPLGRIGPNDPQTYTLTVGDICYVAIGQIVNRDLAAVRYVPSGCLSVTSPTHSPEVAAWVRRDWSGLTEGQLEESLTDDALSYDWRDAVGGLERLCYYYPRTGIPLACRLLQSQVYDPGLVGPFVDEKLLRPVEFNRADINDPWALLHELYIGKRSGPASRYLSERMRSLGREPAPVHGTPDELRDWIADGLTFLESWQASGLYDAAEFHGVTLRAETKALLAHSGSRRDLLRANHMLLEDVFPSEIVRRDDLTNDDPAVWHAEYDRFVRANGPAYAGAVRSLLLRRSIELLTDDETGDPVMARRIYEALFPTAPNDNSQYLDAATLDGLDRTLQGLAWLRSSDVDAAAFQLLRQLPGVPGADDQNGRYETDECAIDCLRRLVGNVRYASDCATYCRSRIAKLRQIRAIDRSYGDTENLDVYDQLLERFRSQIHATYPGDYDNPALVPKATRKAVVAHMSRDTSSAWCLRFS